MQRQHIATACLMMTTAACSFAAFAQSDGPQQDVIANTLTGGVGSFTPAGSGRAHFQGAIGISTSDYFRGAYRNVEEDLDQIAFTTGLSTTIELMRGNQGPISDLSLSLGTANNFASDSERPALDDDGHWYKSNWFAGLAGRLGTDWLGSLTYTAYTVPADDDSDASHEVAIATQYAGDNRVGSLNPQFELAAPFANHDAHGVFASASLSPQTELGGARPVTLTFPLEIGMGFDDYYGAGSGSAGYAHVGVSASTPLDFVPSRYGNWHVVGQVDVLARDHDLRATEPDFARDTVVPSATVSLTMTY
ncbi:hypothetical protein GCM10027040_10440 [Halomonas shantousis]